VSDDGNGFADGDTWPRHGKLGGLIVKSLKQNAKAEVLVESTRDKGVSVDIFFARADAVA
jgi:two-component sensor histidine kinase